MLSPFEATIIGILVEGAASRYEVMKKIQNQSLYWAGSAGAVYSAMDRLLARGFLRIEHNTDPKLFATTDLGIEEGFRFLKTIVPADKLVLDPSLVRLRVRGLQSFSSDDRINYYRAQLEEYNKAKSLVKERERGFSGAEIYKRLSNLAILQLELEETLIQTLLEEELQAEKMKKTNR